MDSESGLALVQAASFPAWFKRCEGRRAVAGATHVRVDDPVEGELVGGGGVEEDGVRVSLGGSGRSWFGWRKA